MRTAAAHHSTGVSRALTRATLGSARSPQQPGVPMEIADAQQAAHRAALRMLTDGLVIGSAGNVSVRAEADQIVVSPAGVPYEQLVPSGYPVIDLETGTFAGRPTSELPLHLELMRAMPHVG